MESGNTFHLNTFTPEEIGLRADTEKLIKAMLTSTDPKLAVKRFLEFDGKVIKAGGQSYLRTDHKNIYLIALGKAAIPMIVSASEILIDNYTTGLAVTKRQDKSEDVNSKIRIIIGDHPIPGENSRRAADEVCGLLATVTKDDLIIFLISGGGSALMSKPIQGISHEDIQSLTNCLLNASVPIDKNNTIRKHLDEVKGGGLLKMSSSAQVISLILSDVIGNDPSIIASGPTVPDPSSFQDCLQIVKDYDLQKKIPSRIMAVLQEGAKGKYPETIKPVEVDVRQHQEIVIGSIDLAMGEIIKKGLELGYQIQQSQEYLRMDIEVEKKRILTEATDYLERHRKGKSILVWGGEVTVNRTGNGKGGRNQHLALLLAEEFVKLNGKVGVALATDGEDGSSDAAGAIIDSWTMERAKAIGLDYQEAIRTQNSYAFFKEINDLIFTGSTGTNVNDLFILIKS